MGEHGELLTQGEVEMRIMRLNDQLDDLTTELARLAEAAADAEVEYKKRYHASRVTGRATLDGNGPGGRVTNDECDDFAMEQAGDLFRGYKVTEGAYQAARDALRAKQSQLDALRTIAANIRSQT